MPNIQKRNLAQGYQTQDPSAIALFQYNQPAGAMKVSENGRHLLPLATPGTGTGWTTDVSSAPYALPAAGRNLAVYNNSNSVGSITLGTDNTVTSLSAGTTDSSGRVGIPCMPNSWTYVACGYSNYVISSASTMLVFLINDETNIQVVAQAFSSTTGNPV